MKLSLPIALWSVLVLPVLLFTALPAQAAGESHCYSIRNADEKNLCLAQVRQKESPCYSIRDADTKAWCLASVSRKRSHCYSIRRQDQKNACLARVR
jgi:hypothetical protein